MKVIRINQLEETEREVKFVGGTSFRALLEEDAMGFSLHKTVIPIGGPYKWHYKNHYEACYCVRGKGILTDLKTGASTIITPDVVYALDNHDEHTFEALQDTVLISVFNPPVAGTEIHNEDGSYSIDPNYNKPLAAMIVDAVEKTKNRYDAIDAVKELLNEN